MFAYLRSFGGGIKWNSYGKLKWPFVLPIAAAARVEVNCSGLKMEILEVALVCRVAMRQKYRRPTNVWRLRFPGVNAVVAL